MSIYRLGASFIALCFTFGLVTSQANDTALPFPNFKAGSYKAHASTADDETCTDTEVRYDHDTNPMILIGGRIMLPLAKPKGHAKPVAGCKEKSVYARDTNDERTVLTSTTEMKCGKHSTTDLIAATFEKTRIRYTRDTIVNGQSLPQFVCIWDKDMTENPPLDPVAKD